MTAKPPGAKQWRKSMVALLDANVILNYLTGREDPYRDTCREIIISCPRNAFTGYIAFHSVSIFWYSLKKPAKEKRELLKTICKLLTVTGASHEQVLFAIENESFPDFEDCLQDICAQQAGADYLVTCNIKDFQAAKTKPCTPDVFLQILSASSQ